jgi:hypothetical protein
VIAGPQPGHVVDDGDAMLQLMQSVLDLQQASHLCVAHRNIQHHGQDFLFEEARIQLEGEK